MSEFPGFTSLVQSLPATVPFVGPEAQERATGKLYRARLGANESGFGPAPSVKEAMRAGAEEVWKYCDPENHDLREALATHYGLSPENIMIGEGIDGLQSLAVKMVILPGMPVVTSLGAYPTFNFHVAGNGGQLVTVPYRGDMEDLEALLDAVTREKAPMVYLANPDNPMGSWHSAADLETFARALPETTMLVLDEAYIETAPADAAPPVSAMIDLPNVLRMRTFSKAYGLAGLRCAYAIGSPGSIGSFDKVRNHFGVNLMAQVACLAALADQDYLQQVCGQIDASRQRIAAIGRQNGLDPLPSATNFVALDSGRDGDFVAALLQELGDRGVFTRMPGVAPLNRCIRISCGPDEVVDIFEQELPGALKAVG